ncbi:MAG: 2,4-dihydroxyhept-2-ene-1,7-dioic acid aldolase [Anaerolineae bacterium]|nr:2,4-dihydroxyhept-2-ene-1,7-dioic acid aldolase [Anaerolineae bacterium]
MTSQNSTENSLKQKLKAGKQTSGAWLHAANAITAEIMARAGFDWLLIDMEHGPGDLMSLVAQLQGMNGTGAVPLVRVPSNDAVFIKRVLDAGAIGILVPNVQTKAEAEAAYQACKYAPDGIRGIASGTRAAYFGQDENRWLTTANARTLVMIQIESPLAVANLDSILEVAGIDVIFIGPRDLSTSMGYFNDPSQPEVQATIATIEQKTLRAGKALATVTGSWEQAEQKYRSGYQMLTLMSDAVSLAQLANLTLQKFKTAFPSE